MLNAYHLSVFRSCEMPAAPFSALPHGRGGALAPQLPWCGEQGEAIAIGTPAVQACRVPREFLAAASGRNR